MASALIVCPEAPYPVAGGGPTRTACMVEYLADRYLLDVVVFQEPGAADPREAFPKRLAREIHVVALPRHSKSPAARAFRNVHRMLRGVPPLVDRFAGFVLPLQRQYDVAVIEHFWCAPYVSQVRPRCGKIVLDLHNIESVLLERCADTERAGGRMVFRRFADACRRMETQLLPLFDLLLTASEVDRERAGGGIVWPNTLPCVAMPDGLRREEIVFSGNLGYHPNIAGARFFASEVWPILRRKRPDLVWTLVGKNPDALPLRGVERIRFTGPVENAIQTLAGARAAVVPLLSGSGTRFKILEAWAAGVPVISTTIGAEGLDATPGEHLLIADTPETFARAVLSVLNDSELSARLSAAGRARFEARYTWRVAWKMLEGAGL